MLFGCLIVFSAFLSWSWAHSCTTLTPVVWSLPKPAHLRLASLSRWMRRFLRIFPPPQWCTLFVDILCSSCLHVECIILFSCTLSMEHSTHVYSAGIRVLACQDLPIRRFVPCSPLPHTAASSHKNGQHLQSLLHSVLQLSLVPSGFPLLHSCCHFSLYPFPRIFCIFVNSYSNGLV